MLMVLHIGATTMENSMEVLQITKNRTAIWFSNSTSGYLTGYLTEENESINLKRYLQKTNTSAPSYSMQWHGSKLVFTDGWMNKEK